MPRLTLTNMFWDSGVGAFFARPALTLYETKGAGPSRGVFYQSGLFNSDRFYLSGAQLWREGAIIGTVTGEDRALFAGGFNGSLDCLVFCTGGLVYKYDGATIDLVAIPSSTLIYDVLFFENRFIYFASNGKFYWSEINDPTNIDALSFATAEAMPDGFVKAEVVVDRMYICGRETIEVWYPSGDTAAPFQPQTSQRMDVGVYSRDAIKEISGKIYFISNLRQIFLLAGNLTQIADDSVLEAMGKAPLDTVSLTVTFIDGREVVLITDKDASTYVFDGENWGRWNRYKKASMSIADIINRDGVSYAADMESGKIYRLSTTDYADDEGYIERVVTCYYPLASGRIVNGAIALQAGRGEGNLVTTDPLVEMRYSDDGGYTWCEWWQAPLGRMGEYYTRPVWRGLGHIKPFGRVYQFRCTDNVEFSPQAAIVNEERN